MPSGVITCTSTVPTAPLGVTMLSEVEEFSVKAAGAPPTSTTSVPARFVPVIVTEVPPVLGPLLALRLVMVGVVEVVVVYVKPLDPVGDVPNDVTTVTSTAPATARGLTAVIWLSETTEKRLAGVSPKYTSVAPVRLT